MMVTIADLSYRGAAVSERWRISLGIVLIALGVAGVIVGFGPLQFGDRLSGRVEADGVVQWGVPLEATSPSETVADGEYGAWKVDYEIDGSGHTGVIIGEYSAGQQIVVSAPPDGSVYATLHEGTPIGLKVLSWLLLPASLLVLAFGGWWLAGGLRAQDARNREIARQQLARMYPSLFPPAPVGPPPPVGPTPIVGPPPAVGPPPVGPSSEHERPAKHPDFFAPYDI